jgi:F-type H+-transporting ATPase subunit c
MKGCRIFAFISFFIIVPASYLILIIVEHETYGWKRLAARAAGESYDWASLNAPTPAPSANKGHKPTAAPVSRSAMLWEFMMENPLSYLLPLIGVAVGLFGNIVPIGSNLMLAPLFQLLEVTNSSESTLALCCLVQAVNNGFLGFFAWCTRDVRFFVCRALFLITAWAWAGYIVGVTNHLTVKDLLLKINDDTDDPTFRNEFDQRDINNLHTYLRIGFGCFMCFMSLFIAIGLCLGGVNRFCCPSYSGGTTPGCKSFCQWIIVLAFSFHTGWLFVANIGAGMGIGRIGGSAVEGMARQPEAAGRIQTAALILAALIEGAALFGVVIGFQIQGKITF